MDMNGYEWLRMGVPGGGCIYDEFSEYLLETRFLTSANYNTHPLQIFFIRFRYYSIVILGGELFFQGEI